MKTTLNCLILSPGTRLTTLFTDKPEGGDLPMEFGPVLKWGDNATTKGPVRLGDKTRRVFAVNQKRLGFDEVALDFEHNTVPGTAAHAESKEPRAVAAYGVYDLRQDGLYFKVNRWTPDGVKNARNYADLSPCVGPAEASEVEFAHSLALCRQGSVFGLKAFSMEVDVPETQTEEEMMMDAMLKLLRKALNLKDDAGEQEIVDGIKGLVALTARIQATESSLTTLTTDVGSAKGEVGKLAGLTADIVALKAAIAANAKALACYHARLDGKLIPLSTEAIEKMDLKTLEETLGKLPAGQVPVVALSAGGAEPGNPGSGLTEADRKAMADLGYSEDAVKKANGIK
ncbi:MAG: phage protease [Kiritimatiellia bacterium]